MLSCCLRSAAMKSPFPCMDPYLELHWRDVHATMIVYMKEQLQPQLSGPLRARVEERFNAGDVNLIEIDLTRGGRRNLLLAQAQVPPEYRTTFQACVYRATSKRPQFEWYRMPLSDPLPAIKIPLRQADADVVLELQ